MGSIAHAESSSSSHTMETSVLNESWCRVLAGSIAMVGLAGAALPAQTPLEVASPDGRNVITLDVRDGALTYSVARNGRPVLTPSRLGFAFRGAPPLRDSLRIVGHTERSHDETWSQPWGEVARVRDHHNEMRVEVAESGAANRHFAVVFRAFDDGVGFRYELPDQPGLHDYEISDELTEFALADNGRAWWIASNRPRLDRSEQLYSTGPVSTLDSVQTPLTIEMSGGLHVVIHEADLVDYPRMFLAGPRMESRTLRAALAPWADGVKVRGRAPIVTPCRSCSPSTSTRPAASPTPGGSRRRNTSASGGGCTSTR
jgi:alpha-glucosidase